jgi:hypothetical protein
VYATKLQLDLHKQEISLKNLIKSWTLYTVIKKDATILYRKILENLKEVSKKYVYAPKKWNSGDLHPELHCRHRIYRRAATSIPQRPREPHHPTLEVRQS